MYMQVLKHSIAIVCIALFLVSCGSSDGKLKTDSGYEYIFYNDSPGDVAKEGEIVYFEFDILDNEGEVLQSYRDTPNKPNIQIPKAGDPIQQANPLMSVLVNCSVNDSVGMFLPLDSIPNPPPQYKDIPFFEYRLKVTDVMTEEAHKAKVEEERVKNEAMASVLKEREGAIATQVSAFAKDYSAGKLSGQLLDGPEGMKYMIHEKGEGPKAVDGQSATVQYYGSLLDGTMFDNSFKRGRGFSFKINTGAVIKGWDLGIPLLSKGGKATLIIPSALGYGERGSPPNIEPNSDLIFYVELEDLQ